jgi:hypothetical protein
MGQDFPKDIDLIHLQHIWNPYIQVMAWWAFQKKIYIITSVECLNPDHNGKKKLPCFYTRKAIQGGAYSTAQMEQQHKSFGI